MKYLVLGSAGQIGKPLANYLKNRNHRVVTFDIVDSRFEDLRLYHNEILKKSMQECDFVYFLAFDVGGSQYLKDRQNTYEFLSNNIKIIDKTFDCLKYYKKPFIFTSSQMSNMNDSSYGVLKRLGEYFTKSLRGLSVMFWNVYGYEKNSIKSHVITDFLCMAHNNGKIHMKTNGSEKRQFLHVYDACSALYILSINYEYLREIDCPLHVTSFEWTKIIDVANIISTMIGNTTVIPGHAVDIQSRRNEPSQFIRKYWSPQFDLKTGIQMVYNEMF